MTDSPQEIAAKATALGSNTTNLLAVGPAGSLWVATLPNKADPTTSANWIWTQLPPIPAT